MLTEAVELRSVVLQELWGLASESPWERTGASEPVSLRRVEGTLYVCARGLVELLGAPATDRERCRSGYPHFGSLRQTVTAGAANVLVGGRLLDRPGDFLLFDALIHQHDGLAHAVEFYAAALRGHTDARTHTQLIVLTRLLRAVAALWIIDARLEQVSPTPCARS